jgi:hypothetical protein
MLDPWNPFSPNNFAAADKIWSRRARLRGTAADGAGSVAAGMAFLL